MLAVSSCQSNHKQITLGIKQYTQDYDERFPLSANADNEDASSNDISGNSIYNVCAGFQRSKNNSTFNTTSDTDR